MLYGLFQEHWRSVAAAQRMEKVSVISEADKRSKEESTTIILINTPSIKTPSTDIISSHRPPQPARGKRVSDRGEPRYNPDIDGSTVPSLRSPQEGGLQRLGWTENQQRLLDATGPSCSNIQ